VQQQKRPSPFGGGDVPFESHNQNGTFDCYNLSGQQLGNFYVGDKMQEWFTSVVQNKELKYKNSKHEYTLQETNATLNLIKSKLWRAHRKNVARICFLTMEDAEWIKSTLEREDTRRFLGFLDTEGWVIEIFEQQIEEARDLGFLDKCFKTLQNIYLQWPEAGKAISLPHVTLSGGSKPEPVFSKLDDTDQDGMAYGCSKNEALFVYTYLYEEGYYRYINNKIPRGTFLLSPKGYIEIERLRRGRNLEIKQAFFIRKFDPELDVFMRPIMNKVQERTGCKIEAVWESPHSDRIDERIFRLIRESSLVVLDIAHDRFNVGFEAGYALALRKPIIAIREKLSPTQPLPFDIATLNCYDYDRSMQAELIEKVSERVLAALEEVKLMK
jgi:hypothetical protein